MFNTDKLIEHVFHYDFITYEKEVSHLSAEDALQKNISLPIFCPDGLRMVFEHTTEQKGYIQSLIATYGLSDQGLGNIFGCLSSVDKFYRQATILSRGSGDTNSMIVHKASPRI